MLIEIIDKNIDSSFKILAQDGKLFFYDKELKSISNNPILKRLNHTVDWCLKNKKNKHKFSFIFFKENQPILKDVELSKKEQGNSFEILFLEGENSEKLEEEFKFFENLPYPVVVSEAEPFNDPGPRIIHCNKAFIEESKYSKSEILGRSPRIMQGDRTSELARENIREGLSAWQTIDQDILNYKKNGEEFWVNLFITPLQDETGWWCRWLSIQRDITSFKLIEESNRSEKRFLEKLEEVASIGYWRLNVETNEVTWSKQTYKIHNILENDPFDKKNSLDFFAQIDQKRIKGYLKNCRERGVSFDDKFEFYDATKTKKILRVTGEVVTNTDNQVEELFGTVQDITSGDEKSEEISFLLKKLCVGIWKFDLINDILYWDESMYRLYSLSPERFSGAYDAWLNSLHPDYLESGKRAISDAAKGIKEFDLVFAIINGFGEKRFISGKAFVERAEDGRALSMTGFNVDVTSEVNEQKRKDDEKAKLLHTSKLATLGEMAASIAHEVKNPLAIISATTNLLKRHNSFDEKSEDLIKQLTDSIGRINKIASSLSTFSRKSEKDEFELVSINKIIEESIILVQPKLKKSFCNLINESLDDVTVSCNSIELEQVVVNLINNSIDANAEKEGSWIKIRTVKNNKTVEIQVIDSGNGINKETVERIFDPFFTTKKIGEGTGLGLSISKGIAQSCRGDLNYRLIEGHTAFVLSLPIVNLK